MIIAHSGHTRSGMYIRTDIPHEGLPIRDRRGARFGCSAADGRGCRTLL